MDSYIADIGLEVHVQLNTQTKAFSREISRFGDAPNSNISYVSLALPGTLPMLNKAVVAAAVKLGLALNSTINTRSGFDRKNYFYPDLPKSYQITQQFKPICRSGAFTFRSGTKWKSIAIDHIHIEEDAGRSLHDVHDTKTCLDFNRAGTALLELVTQPEFNSGQEVHDFLSAFQNLIRFLDISDGHMEQGSLRADLNISLRRSGDDPLGTRCEIKNINSKKMARDAIEYEIKRQQEILNKGQSIDQESRLFDPSNGQTYSMRAKEDALDYRYFPDPDLPALVISDEYIRDIKKGMGPLPEEMRQMLIEDYGIDNKKSELLLSDKAMTVLFLALADRSGHYQASADLVIQQYGRLPQSNVSDLECPLLIKQLSDMITMIAEGLVSTSAAYNVILPGLSAEKDIDVNALAARHGLLLESADASHSALCRAILEAHPAEVQSFLKGKKQLLGFFMGEYMRRADRRADPRESQEIFKKLLNEMK